MEPNPWRSFNPGTYSHLGHSSNQGATAGINRYDLPLLAAEQAGLNPGLSLGSSLPVSHASPSGRSLGTLPGASVPLLSNNIPQYLDSSLQSQVTAQNTLKPTHSMLPSDSAIIRSEGHSYGHSNAALNSELSRSKLLFNQDHGKESFGLSHNTERIKGWGLSEFLPMTSTSTFGGVSGIDVGPPPAHSGVVSNKNTGSNIRSSFSAEDLIQQVPQNKYPSMTTPLFNPGLTKSEPNVISPTSSLLASYGIGSQDISNSKPSYQPTQNVGNLNYDPVSPVSDTGQQADHFSDINLQEFAHIAAQQKAQQEARQQLLMQQKSLQQELFHSRNSAGINTHAVRQSSNSPQIQSPHGLHNTPSPIQQASPLSKSPQSQVTSTNVVGTPPTIQAIPDSTTKPKKPRSRKKKATSITNTMEVVKEELSQDLKQFHNMPNQQNVNMQNVNQNSQMVNVSGHGYRTSPQNNYMFNQQKKTSSPHTPQSYSPHLQQQQQQQQPMMEGNYNTSIQRTMPSSPLVTSNNASMVNEQFRMQHNVSVGNLPVSSSGSMPVHSNSGAVPHGSVNQMTVISDNNIRVHGRHIHDRPNNSNVNTGEQQYNFPQSRSFVDQLTTGTDIDMDKVGMEDPLGMHALGLVDGEGYRVQPQQNTVYTEVQGYENQYGYNESPVVHRQTSTIDEDALSSIISHSNPTVVVMQTYNKDSSPETWQHHQEHPVTMEESAPARSVTTHPEYDDELAHLSKPPPAKKTNPVKHEILVNPISPPHSNPRPPEPKPKIEIKKNPNSGFMDSFLSFIQGKKPETLSSVNSSVVKRPELPKYIPEPPRKRPVETVESKFSSDSAASTPRPESLTSPSTSQNDSIAFSDEEEGSNMSSTVQNIVSSLNEDGKPSLKLKISLNKTQTKNVKSALGRSEPSARGRKKSSPKGGRGRKKKVLSYESEEEAYIVSSGDDDEYQPDSNEEEESQHIAVAPPSPKPVRKTSSRRAKDKAKEKKTYVVDSDSDDIQEIKPKKVIQSDREEEEYDSDRDPEWAPFAMENKRHPMMDTEKKSRTRTPKIKIGRKRSNSNRKSLDDDTHLPFKLHKSKPSMAIVHQSKTMVTDHRPVQEKKTIENVLISPYDPKPGFRIGEFVMDKKDMNNFECFPIWKIEQGRMMRKFELITDNGKIRHKALCTFSSWMPKMEMEFLPIRVIPISCNRDSEIVEVYEEDRPKPKLDSSLANAYEEDPLADMFNIYLQIFLSQALEPGFLSAILESGEDFYLGPLNKIDKIITEKLSEVDLKVKWTQVFTKSLKAKPHIREVDRKNLKVTCMACTTLNEVAIKSVHLFGQSYNPITLEELPSNITEGGSVEFMIGPTAANYVMEYHSLYHFKFNLSKRCSAKVDIVRQGYQNLENAEILDRCLNNRTWVLNIFDDLKKMLDKG